MAFATVRHGFHQVGPAIPLRIACGARFKSLIRIEQQCPHSHEGALIVRKAQRVLPIRRMHGLEAEEVGLDGAGVSIAHVGVAGEGHRRIEFLVAGRDTLVNGVQEIRVVVIADPRFLVGSDIGRVQGSERQHEGASTRKGDAAVGGVAGLAVRGAREVLAALDGARAFEFGRNARGIRSVILRQRHVSPAGEIHGMGCKHHDPQKAD